MIQISNSKDLKNEQNLWLKSYNLINENGKSERHTTRSYNLWRSIVSRCRAGGLVQSKNPTYVGVTNNFASYQIFTDWCQEQYGFWNRNPSNTFWHLDKDLLVQGNKIYSENFCLFVPQEVNKLFNIKSNSRGVYPLGVSYQDNRFKAQCNVSNKPNYLGFYKTPNEAHRAWQRAKLEQMIIIRDKNYSETISNCIQVRVNSLTQDIQSNRETFKL